MTGSTRQLGPALLVEGTDVLKLQAIVGAALKVAATRDGIGPSPDALRISRTIADTAVAVMAERGHADVRDEPTLTSSIAERDLEIEVEEVARMTGLSERQARRLTSDLGGRKTRSGTWLIQRALVEAHLIERQELNA